VEVSENPRQMNKEGKKLKDEERREKRKRKAERGQK
jgi:hypothetical protein